ncbi:MAG: alpha/beta hydrolase [Actinomycetota bacterium]|nr:alpha/beta hydrolase [Actinomycetota bacterium]
MVPFGHAPTRFEPANGDRGRVAIVLPGAGYSPAHPVLEIARLALLQQGWTVQQVWWEAPSDRFDDVDGTVGWVCRQAEASLAAETAADALLLAGKSLGTLAAKVAASRQLPAVWFTPLLDVGRAPPRYARPRPPRLLVGGGSDESWPATIAERLGGDQLVLEGADHGLVVSGDVAATAHGWGRLAERVTAFFAALPR